MKKILLLVFCVIIGFGCEDPKPESIMVVTGEPENVTTNSVSVFVEVDNINAVDKMGVLYSKEASFESSQKAFAITSGKRAKIDILGLEFGTIYYIKAFASDRAGSIVYGVIKSFTTENQLLKLSESEMTINSVGGMQQFTVNSNVSWNVVSDQPWCDIVTTSGNENISFNIEANTGIEERIAVITVIAGTLQQYVQITQLGQQPPIEDGATITLHVETAGALHTLITESQKHQITNLTLTGNLNSTDISFISEMAKGVLSILDLSGTNITSIGDYAFRDCISLENITIPNSVTSIGHYAFGSCRELTSITIPNSVTSIGNAAFTNCAGLTSVTIENSVTSIGNGVFSGCISLTSITMPNSVTSIGDYAFWDCTDLTSVTIGNSVTSIEGAAFGRCTSLKEFHTNNPVPPNIDNTCFTGVNKSTCKVYVPNGSYTAYSTAQGWNEFKNIID